MLKSKIQPPPRDIGYQYPQSGQVLSPTTFYEHWDGKKWAPLENKRGVLRVFEGTPGLLRNKDSGMKLGSGFSRVRAGRSIFAGDEYWDERIRGWKDADRFKG